MHESFSQVQACRPARRVNCFFHYTTIAAESGNVADAWSGSAGQLPPTTKSLQNPRFARRRMASLRGTALAKSPLRRHIRRMPYRGPKTFGSRAEPRAVTGEATGLPLTGLPPGADRRPPGFGEAAQPLMQEHPLVTGEAASFTPHRPPRPDKTEGGVPLHIQSELLPKGDQPQAIAELVAQANAHEHDQVLLGVTGSGKTFTMAKVIEATQRPALVLAPNKTLAAQLYGEFKSFFPENAVEYFVSYYDYYQPEAYIPRTDTYIEKDSSINEQIDRMRHAATRALIERDDVIIVASVSCIYGI